MAFPPLIKKLFGTDYASGKLLENIIPDVFMKKKDADAAYLGKSATAAKATADANGKNIAQTYISKGGDQGSVAGYATSKVVTQATTVSDDTDENICVTGAVKVTVNNGTVGKTWDKSVDIRNASASVQLGSSWTWAGGKVPKISANCAVMLHWGRDKGVAVLISAE